MKSLKPKGKARVSQMINNSGNSAANQFEINYDNCVVFKSYNTIIAQQYRDGSVVIDSDALEYSRTTSKHLYIFLDMTRKEIEASIKEGDILLKKLN